MKPIGFQLYSSHIARDTSLSVYRKFAVLNTRNILYLQSELADLELQLQRLDAQADNPNLGNDIWAIPRSWRSMRDAGILFQQRDGVAADESPDVDPRGSWDVVLRIRKVLKEYNKALQAQAWLQSLEQPTSRVHAAMRTALRCDIDLRTSISKTDVEYLEGENFHDLINVTPDPNREAFSRFLVSRFGFLFFSSKERQIERRSGLGVFPDDRVRRTTRVVAVVLSSILPVLSIIILYFVHSTNVHLGLIIVFSALFSGVIALVSDARNVEVMAATAAYAAVLVVFVSGNLHS